MSNYSQRPVNTSDISLYNHVHPVQNSFGLDGVSNQFEVLCISRPYSISCLLGHEPTVYSGPNNSYQEVQSSGSDWYANQNSVTDGAFYLKQTDIGATNSSWRISTHGNNCGGTNGILCCLNGAIVKTSGSDYAHWNNCTIDNSGTLCTVSCCLSFGLNTDCLIICHTYNCAFIQVG